MKIKTVLFILAIAISVLLGFICEIIAPDTGNRNWISFSVAFVTIAAALIPAIGLYYQNAKRGVSIKSFSWLLSLILIASNIIFSCFEYKVNLYIAISLLITVIGWIIIYGLQSAKSE